MLMTDDELIAALEAADGPSRELDGRIEIAALDRKQRGLDYEDCGVAFVAYAHTVPDYKKYDTRCTVPHSVVRITHGDSVWLEAWHDAPRYTGSLDIALTLVPEGGPFVLAWSGKWAEHMPRSGKTIYEAVLPKDTADYEEALICDLTEIGPFGVGATPALALCIAALKARKEATDDTH